MTEDTLWQDVYLQRGAFHPISQSPRTPCSALQCPLISRSATSYIYTPHNTTSRGLSNINQQRREERRSEKKGTVLRKFDHQLKRALVSKKTWNVIQLNGEREKESARKKERGRERRRRKLVIGFGWRGFFSPRPHVTPCKEGKRY